MSPSLAGLHDREAVAIAPPGTWVVDTVALSEHPQPIAYPTSLEWIGRLNHGYGSTGTLPPPDQYDAFAESVAHYVAGSSGCRRWVIGNETNLSREWPNGQPIYPWHYAAAYKLCRQAIHALPGHAQDEVLIAVPGPWNADLKYSGNPNGDWLLYLRQILELLASNMLSTGAAPVDRVDIEFDGFAFHAYCHGYNVALVTSAAMMDAPFQDRHYNFRTYQDSCVAIPEQFHHLPCYITEANGGPGWQAVGLMPAMLADVDAWNQSNSPAISCVAFFRYPNEGDGYEMVGKDNVIAEYLAAAGHGYQSPMSVKEITSMPEKNFLPSVSNGAAAAPPSPRDIDQRLIDRGTKIIDFQPTPGQLYWRLVKAQFLPVGTDPGESGGRHGVYIEAVDEAGNPVAYVPFDVQWTTGHKAVLTNGKAGFDAANFPFSEGRDAFNVLSANGDTVQGIGMGQDDPAGWNAGEHTSTLLGYQRRVAPTFTPTFTPTFAPTFTPTATPITPAGARIRSGPGLTFPVLGSVATGVEIAITGRNHEATWWRVQHPLFGIGWTSATVVSVSAADDVPIIEPTVLPPPVTAPAPATGNKWDRTIAWILQEEGGYTANDEGSPANFGINQAANPDLDVKNISRDQAVERFRTKYYIGSGADQQPWPFCLLIMNASVQFGESEAAQLLAQSAGNPWQFQGLCQLYYSQIKQDSWDRNGKAWMARCGRVMEEASKA